MLETAFKISSIVLQVLGLLSAAVGLSNTFKDSSNAGDRFFTRVMVTELGVARQLWSGVKRLSRRLFGAATEGGHWSLGTAMEVGFAGSARGIVQFGPLPDPARDPDASRLRLKTA